MRDECDSDIGHSDAAAHAAAEIVCAALAKSSSSAVAASAALVQRSRPSAIIERSVLHCKLHDDKSDVQV